MTDDARQRDRIMAFVAVVVLFGGYVWIFRPGEERIATEQVRTARMLTQIRDDTALLARRQRLEEERGRTRRRLQHADLDGEPSAVVAHFLYEAARTAARTATTITSIGVPTAAVGAEPPPGHLSRIPLDIAIEGRYVDVLRAVRALSITRVIAAVELVSLSRKSGRRDDRTLVASLRVGLAYLPRVVHDDRPRLR